MECVANLDLAMRTTSGNTLNTFASRSAKTATKAATTGYMDKPGYGQS